MFIELFHGTLHLEHDLFFRKGPFFVRVLGGGDTVDESTGLVFLVLVELQHDIVEHYLGRDLLQEPRVGHQETLSQGEQGVDKHVQLNPRGPIG